MLATSIAAARAPVPAFAAMLTRTLPFASARDDAEGLDPAFAVAVETLALIGSAALVFDASGRVLVANRQMRALAGFIRWRPQGLMAFADSRADAMFQRAVGELTRGRSAPVQAFAARGHADDGAMIARILPIRATPGATPPCRAAVLVLNTLTPPEAPAVELMQSLFNLTPAEARVARGLAAGATIDDLAATGSVSRNTVRSQLRVIMEKTGCHRQAEAVALFCRVAATGGGEAVFA